MARGTWGGALDPNIFQVNLQFTLGTVKAQTGFKLRDVAAQDNSCEDVANEVRAQLESPFRNLLTAVDFLTAIDVVKLGTEESFISLFTPAEGPGALQTSLAQTLPSFMVCNVSLKSEIRKRYGQGRMYLPLRDENHVQGDTINALGVTAMNVFVNPLIEHFTGDALTHDLLMVNAHPAMPQRAAPGAPNYRAAIPASWYDVVSVRVNTAITTLRSRKLGVGT